MSEDTTRGILAKKKSESTFIHIRVDKELKDDLFDYARSERTSVTALVVSLIEDMLYSKKEEEEEESEDEIYEVILNSLGNLERRMEIRLATLQDTFNSLIGRLIDSQQAMLKNQRFRVRKEKRSDDDEFEEEEEIDFSDVLAIDKEEEIYKRVKRFLGQEGKIVDLKTIIAHIEIDRSLKRYLEEKSAKMPGWKEALITDAINEAAYELGFDVLEGE